MQSGLYVALSSQVSLERRLETIADNVANAGTVGFRSTGIKFEDLVSGSGTKAMSFVSPGSTYLSTESGPIKHTGNALDFAVKGDAWFGLMTPDGPIVTRDGRFTVREDGMLVSVEGHSVMDAGGAEVFLNPAAGTPTVGSDGTLRQNGQIVGAIGLFEYKPGTDFTRAGNSGLVPPGGDPVAIVDRADVGVMQGYVEGSNVNPVMEITRLITVQRTFENVTAMIRDSETALDEAIRSLGS